MGSEMCIRDRAQWFAPLLKRHLADQPAADAVVGADAGPLLWQDQPEGWLLATRPQSPARDAVDERLQEQGLTRSELEGDAEVLSVWTRLVRQRGRQPGVDAQLAVAQVRSSALNWWGESLMALAQRQNCLLYTSPSPRDGLLSRMPSSA